MFKVGDKVRCINAEGNNGGLKLGDVFTVRKVMDKLIDVGTTVDPVGLPLVLNS